MSLALMAYLQSIKIAANSYFNSTSEREQYYIQYPQELKESMYVIVANQLFQYINGVWVDRMPAIKGEQGIQGVQGEIGPQGEVGPQGERGIGIKEIKLKEKAMTEEIYSVINELNKEIGTIKIPVLNNTTEYRNLEEFVSLEDKPIGYFLVKEQNNVIDPVFYYCDGIQIIKVNSVESTVKWENFF